MLLSVTGIVQDRGSTKMLITHLKGEKHLQKAFFQLFSRVYQSAGFTVRKSNYYSTLKLKQITHVRPRFKVLLK